MKVGSLTGKIWKFNTSILETHVRHSKSLVEVLKKMGLARSGKSTRSLRKRLDKEGISYFHFSRKERRHKVEDFFG